MKKYNLSKIMKRAWELVKKVGMTISSGLKQAWKEAKNMALKGSEKQIAWATDIINRAESIIENFENSEKFDTAPAEIKSQLKTLHSNMLENMKSSNAANIINDFHNLKVSSDCAEDYKQFGSLLHLSMITYSRDYRKSAC